MTKRLYRSRRDRMLAGVCGGLADYFDIDPTIVRVAFVLVTLCCGAGVALYILMWIIVPEGPAATAADAKASAKASAKGKEEADEQAVAAGVPVARSDNSARVYWGVVLVLLGALLLLRQILPWDFNGELLVPTVLIAVGLVVVARSFDS